MLGKRMTNIFEIFFSLNQEEAFPIILSSKALQCSLLLVFQGWFCYFFTQMAEETLNIFFCFFLPPFPAFFFFFWWGKASKNLSVSPLFISWVLSPFDLDKTVTLKGL